MERSSGDGAGGGQVFWGFFLSAWKSIEMCRRGCWSHTIIRERCERIGDIQWQNTPEGICPSISQAILFYSLVHQNEKKKLKTWDKSISNLGKMLYIAGNKRLAKSEKKKETRALDYSSSWRIQSRFQSLALHWLSLSEGSLQHIRSLFCQINLCFKARFTPDRLVILKVRLEQHEHHTYDLVFLFFLVWSLSLWCSKDLSFSASDWLTYSFLAHSAGLQYNQWRSALFPTFTDNI